MPNERLTLEIAAQASGHSDVDRLTGSVSRFAAASDAAGSASDRMGKRSRASVSDFAAAEKAIGSFAGATLKGVEAIAAFIGAHTLAAGSIAKHSAQVDTLANGYRGLRLALSPTLFTAASIGVGILAEETIRLVNAQGKLIEQRSILAAKSGLSYGTVENIGVSAGLSGGNASTITAALKALQSRAGTVDYSSALDSIGVAKYLQDSNSPRILAEIAKGLSGIADPAARAKAAVDLFGADVAEKVLPQLNQRFADSAKAVGDWGLTLSETSRNQVYQFRRDIQNFKDDVFSLGTGFEALKGKIEQALTVGGAKGYAGVKAGYNWFSEGADKLDERFGTRNPYSINQEAKGNIADSNLILSGTVSNYIAKYGAGAGFASGTLGDAFSARQQRSGTRDDLESKLSAGRSMETDMKRVLDAGGLTPAQVSSYSAALVGATQQINSARAGLKILEESERLTAAEERRYQATLEKMRELREAHEDFYIVDPGRRQSIISTQDIADNIAKTRPRSAPSLLRNGEYSEAAANGPFGNYGSLTPGMQYTGGGLSFVPDSDAMQRASLQTTGALQRGMKEFQDKLDSDSRKRDSAQISGVLDTADRRARLLSIGAGPGDELKIAGQQLAMREAALGKERSIIEANQDLYDITAERYRLDKQAADNTLEYMGAVSSYAARQKDQFASLAGGAFNSLVNGTISSFIRSEAIGLGRTVVENLARTAFDSKEFGSIKSHLAFANPDTLLGKALKGTWFDKEGSAKRPLGTIADPIYVASAALPGAGGGSTGPRGIESAIQTVIGAGGFGGGSTANPLIFSGLPGGTLDGLPIDSAGMNHGVPSVAGGSGFGFNTGTLAKAAAAGGGAIAAFQDFRAGGAKNDTAGVGAALMGASGIAAMFGPAGAPVALGLAIAGMATSFISAILPDPHKVRQEGIQKYIEKNQYQAPTAINATMSSGGGFADFDSHGRLRTSSFSPFPNVTEPYMWWGPNNTPYAVPGAQTSQFGASRPPEVHVHVHAIDTQAGVDFINKNAPTVHAVVVKGLQNFHGSLTREIQRAANL